MDPNRSVDLKETSTGQTYPSGTQRADSGTSPESLNTTIQDSESTPVMQNIQTETHSSQAAVHPAKRIVGVIFSAVEIILGLRFIFKLLGANAENSFITFLYGVTGFFVKIFEGIFSQVTVNESSGAVFEPATLLAMLIIGLLALVVLKLMTPRVGSHTVKTDYAGPTVQKR